MTTQSDHPPVVKEFRVRIPHGKHAVELRRLNASDDPEVSLRPEDGWQVATHLEDFPGCYSVTVIRKKNGMESPITGYLPLYGGRGSWRFAFKKEWDNECFDIEAMIDGEWTLIEDDNMWELAFGSLNV